MANPTKIHLIEDDPFLYKVLGQRLEDEGFEVKVTSDGSAAIEDARAFKPDLVLLDLILPKKTGFDVLADMRKSTDLKAVPVLVLSNLGQQEDIDQIQKLGVEGYLVKADHSLSEMVEKVREAVKR